ncbi:bifunctional phosphopantothenoylcysteine decarboxylase/phosphopantothenate--cysteine ligase CoaBC [Candidatus Hydrogenedentota bacterium]
MSYKDAKAPASKTIILGVCGSIAAYKACEIASALVKEGVDVHTVMTNSATKFVAPLTFETLTHKPVVFDMFDGKISWDNTHIPLANKADLLLIAPASANMLGKFASGIADDFLTTVYLAVRCPVLIAPAMNDRMYDHTAVKRNVEILKGRGTEFIEPEEGPLACGTVGKGRLAEPGAIVSAVLSTLERKKDMTGTRILITAGPTREFVDPVRFLSSPSSGKMGCELALAARERGGDVSLVLGPGGSPPPEGVNVIPVVTAAEMAEAVFRLEQDCDVFISSAAVADYTPSIPSPSKIKKSSDGLNIEFKRTVDILAEIGKRKGGRIVVGFAAETEDLIGYARRKLEEKNADFIVANDVSRPEAGFVVDTNIASLVGPGDYIEELPVMTKAELAHRILDKIAALRD